MDRPIVFLVSESELKQREFARLFSGADRKDDTFSINFNCNGANLEQLLNGIALAARKRDFMIYIITCKPAVADLWFQKFKTRYQMSDVKMFVVT